MQKRFKRAIQFSITLATLVLIMTFVFMELEKYTFFDSLWMTIISVLAVGYGDLVPTSNAGKVFAMFLIPITMGFSTYLLTFIAASMIEGRLSNKWERKKMDQQIKRMKDHYIICGYGRVGEQVLKELQENDYQAIVIDLDEEAINRLPEETPYICDDAKKNDVLQHAEIEKATGMIVTTSDGATNVFITLTAKGENPEVKVIARAEEVETEDKIKRAGADHVVNTPDLGGRRMALAMIKPASMSYVDSILRTDANAYQVAEFNIPKDSSLSNVKVKDTQFEEKYGVLLLGIQREGKFIGLPTKAESIQPGDILIIFGDDENIANFQQETNV